jgi:2-dehydropantoate 2-reductase
VRIAVVGAGAIGGFLAAALARSGNDVVIVARGAHLEAIRREGIAVDHSDLGPFVARVDASDDLRDFGAVDVALLTFKAHQWSEFLPQFVAGTAVVTLQNGLPFWFRRHPPLRSVDPSGDIGATFDDAHTIGGVVHVSGHIIAPGHIHQSGGTRYVLGSIDPASVPLLDRLTESMRAAGLQPEINPNIRELVWLKLVNNVGLNPVSAIHRATISQMTGDTALREEVRALMSEALAVGQALGVVRHVDIDARLAYAQRLSDVQTSMLQDRLAGRPLELDPIVGAVIELGSERGVDVSRLRAVYERLR